MASVGWFANPVLAWLEAKKATEHRKLKCTLSAQLSKDLSRLYCEGIHTDVIILVGRTSFKAHRAILLARAPKFYNSIARTSASGVFPVTNVEPSEIDGFLRIMYSSDWSINEREQHILKMMHEDRIVSNPNQNDDALSHTFSLSKDTEEDSYDLEPASELGKDLLTLLRTTTSPDITIQIENVCFHLHRAILCARSSYFAAMLSGCWAESSKEIIQIQGITPVYMIVMMGFIYGGTVDLPKNADPGHVFVFADMYGLEGLKEVAIYVLRRDYCKFFHKPVVGMQQSVVECLSIVHSLGEEQLYNACIRWIEKYFVACWSEKSFSALHPDLQRKCLSLLIQSLSYRDAAFILMESDRLISILPGVKWAERALNLASELKEECVHYIVEHFSVIIKSKSFFSLLQAQGMSSRPYLLEHIFNEIEKNISIQNCCFLFLAVNELLELASENEMGFTCKIEALCYKLWTFLVQSFYAVRHSEGWKSMSPDHQQKIQAAALDKGDDRRLSKKPIFTSSQQGKSRLEENKKSSWSIQSKTHLGADFSYKKMKSESLGASGYTSNTSRNTTGKTKDDDLRSKEGKKAPAKVLRDQKPTEKIVPTKLKTIVKPKTENNGNAKTEACVKKVDSTAPQKSSSSGRLSTRPKSTNGNNSLSNPRTPKSTGRDLGSPVKVIQLGGKSANAMAEHQNGYNDKQNYHRPADEQHSASSSPQSGKTLTNRLNNHMAHGGASKSESASKKLNGSSIKKKVKEAEFHEDTNSLSMAKQVSNGNELVSEKAKATRTLITTAHQRPKSAPAAISKKQGAAIQGNGPSPSRSVTSKHSEVKTDMKPLNKRISKNTLPPTKISLKAKVTASKNNLSDSNCLSINHKEPKQKIQTESNLSKVKATGLNTRREFKSSPCAFKNSHEQKALSPRKDIDKAYSLKNLQYVENESEHISSCDPVNMSEHSKEQCLKDIFLNPHCQNSSAGNNCHHSDLCCNTENILEASSKLYVSDTKDNLPIVKESVVDPKSNVSFEKFALTILGEDNLGCKNICDSENSKCADSSSESELCSVKEVDKNALKQNAIIGISDAYLICSQTTYSTNQNSEENGSQIMQDYSSYQPSTVNNADENPGHSESQYTENWNKHSNILHDRESPESESGSASTSSDDIKPRSEDYDAGGSQDDDGSNERGISKCSTMRCHDFLGRSSSDTSTPEELKGYDGSLRLDLKMKKEHPSDLFRVNSTSDDEGPQRRPDIWIQKGVCKNSLNQKAMNCNSPFSQETEHLSSSADETEDERSEAENAAEKALSDGALQPFQGIINLAFDDINEIDHGNEKSASNKNFTRSVLLSVDECEELGSDEGESNILSRRDPMTPSDVFDKICNDHPGTEDLTCSQKESDLFNVALQNECKDLQHNSSDDLYPEGASSEKHLGKEQIPLTGKYEESGGCNYTIADCEVKSQIRPCHLELYTTETLSDSQKFCCAKTVNICKSQFLDHQGKDNHTPPTENCNSAGNIDSLAQICMYEHRPSKSLSPIYEVDPDQRIEQIIEANLDSDFEDQLFVERDWILLKQLLADHSSDVDIINSVPEDLSLAQYLINQTLLLSREHSKSQGKSQGDTSSRWGDATSPYDDSTSVTMTSFSPDDCSSPHGEWTILELETHH
ncbi:hypothetical protein GDO86_007712 [Hymenochirus boettgeri]|uniref:BTB domain-containing protein n=1 Tax=Hymenochirus boettgeri TaxID=247094 RepID=A0A8T2J028_9PIPI|nr:hypothetical protein GDO86_007712 [Hymenochirus boettgeri]